jgi:TonB-dependent starch-binding outer membrane protein SusC
MTFQERRRYYNTLNANLYATIKLPFNISYQINFAPRYQWYEFMNHQSVQHEDWANLVDRQNVCRKKFIAGRLITWLNGTRLLITFISSMLLCWPMPKNSRVGGNYMSAQNFQPTDALGFHRMQAGTGTTFQIESNDEYETANALMGRVFYSLKDKYMLTLTMRRDGYSAFGTETSVWLFPVGSFGLGISPMRHLPKMIFLPTEN